MALTIYKLSEYVNWKQQGGSSVAGGGGGGSIITIPPVDLSNYYTKTELQTAGLSVVDWGNVVNFPYAFSFADSLVVDINNIVTLVGDVVSPGINKYYGTDATGIKGWYVLPGGATSPQNNILYWDDTNNWYMPYPTKPSGGGVNVGLGALYNYAAIKGIIVPPSDLPTVPEYGAMYNWYAFGRGILTNPDSDIYGVLYNWYTSIPTWGSIAPSGWRMPTLTDIQTLQTFLGGESVAGGKMKYPGFTMWQTPNTGADNSSGFNAIATGLRTDSAGEYGSRYQLFAFWTSTQFDSTTAYVGILDYVSANFEAGSVAYDKKFGLPIRLIKEYTILEDGQTGTMIDYDGHVYSTICIGDQEWMAENLKVRHTADGGSVFIIKDAELWVTQLYAAACIYNNVADVYTSDFAPDGWKVPTSQDWQILYKYFYPSATEWDWTNTVGGALKEIGFTHWADPNTGATNSTGFTALPSGYRGVDGAFSGLGQLAVYACADEQDGDSQWIVNLNVGPDSEESKGAAITIPWYDEPYVTGSGNGKQFGAAVRLVKKITTLTHGQVGTMTDYDGHIYPTICIGTQEWMTKDFVCTHYNTGVVIPEVTDDSTWDGLITGAMSWYV